MRRGIVPWRFWSVSFKRSLVLAHSQPEGDDDALSRLGQLSYYC